MSDNSRATRVRERLEFVDIITSLNPQFLNPQLVRHTDDNGWTHPWKYFDSLRNYLLLTCFDLLGQPSHFKDFGTWLSASSTEPERSAILARAEAETSLLKSVAFVHTEYLAMHGSKRAFYRFIQAIIPVTAADDLLFSVSIRKIDTVANMELESIDAPEKKLAFLYSMRNSYTHQALNVGSPSRGVFPNWGDPILIDGVPKQGWEPIHIERFDGYHLEYGVRDWPNALRRAVEAGLLQIESRGV